MMVIPRRWCVSCLKKYLLIAIFLSFLLALLLGVLLIVRTDLDLKLKILNRHVIDSKKSFALLGTVSSRVVTHPEPYPSLKQSEKHQRVFGRKHVNGTVRPVEVKVGHEIYNPLSEKKESFDQIQPYNKVHVFYYVWYATPKVDGTWKHWNHRFLPNWKKEDKKSYPMGRHFPPLDIASNFYPALGCYSSSDPKVMGVHMKQIKEAGIGVVSVSWFPPGMYDQEGKDVDYLWPIIMDAAHNNGLKVCLHVEPYKDRNPINFREHLKNFMTKFGTHPALYRARKGGKYLPLFYIYDSYITPAQAWRELFSSKGNLSVRGTDLDGIFVGLLVEMQHRFEIKKGHFDGFYTYFSVNGFTYGSSWKNWKSLATFAYQNSLLFIPSVGPGYIDTQVRPWNVANIRHRRHGKYYNVAWRSALAAPAKMVSITSFNEWHEGTQIEPAIAKTTSMFSYLDYEPEGPNHYLNLTLSWVKEIVKQQEIVT